MMDPATIKPGRTYRSRAGLLDYFVMWKIMPDLQYRVETGEYRGRECLVDILEFAARVTAEVPNHRNITQPPILHTFEPDES